LSSEENEVGFSATVSSSGVCCMMCIPHIPTLVVSLRDLIPNLNPSLH